MSPRPPAGWPRLHVREAWRVRALVVLALACALPAALRGRVGDVDPTPSPRCAAGAVRGPAGVLCAPAAGAPLPALAGWWMGTPVDLNAARARDLTVVPGIGAKLAARIVEDRAARGPFRAVDEVRRVKGIGPKLAARIARICEVR